MASPSAASRRSIAYRAAVAGRVLLAAFGGYGVAALATALLSLVLPLARSEAVAFATLLSFTILVVAIVVVFAARTLAVAALRIGAAAIVLGGSLWLVTALRVAA